MENQVRIQYSNRVSKYKSETLAYLLGFCDFEIRSAVSSAKSILVFRNAYIFHMYVL
jgi:hypothetical protein